jgi:hypothetical protein
MFIATVSAAKENPDAPAISLVDAIRLLPGALKSGLMIPETRLVPSRRQAQALGNSGVFNRSVYGEVV